MDERQGLQRKIGTSSEDQRDNPQEGMLRSWIENGLDEKAVASYGASVNVLKNILAMHTIPPYPLDEMLPYQQELLKDGGYLYYAKPYLERIAQIRPDLANEIMALYPGWNPQEIQEELSTSNMNRGVRGYALGQSVRHHFFEQTGIKADLADIYQLVLNVIPAQLGSYTETTQSLNVYTDEDWVKFNADQKLVSSIEAQLHRQQLAEILSSCLKRRGIVLYYSQNMFDDNQVFAGHEAEDEIMVVSSRLLPASVISGIEILSEADRQAINKT